MGASDERKKEASLVAVGEEKRERFERFFKR